METITSSPVAASIEVTSARASFGARAGLSSEEAQRRLTEFGTNEIRRKDATSPFILLGHQFASPVIWLLLGACAVSLGLGERAVMALRSMTAPRGGLQR